MSDEFDKKIRLQALQNLRDKNLAKNRFSSSDMNKFDLERGKNLSKGQLDNDSFVAKGSNNPDITPSRTVVGKTDKINNIGDISKFYFALMCMKVCIINVYLLTLD